VARFLVGFGIVVFAFGALWQLGIVPGSRLTLPPPVALSRPTVLAVPTRAPTLVMTPIALVQPTAVATVIPTRPPTVAPTPVLAPTPGVIHPIAADTGERNVAMGGYAVRMAIPAIKLETSVEQGGIVADTHGGLVWETRPFVAVHYGDFTALLGKTGNAVIAGHVVTINEGNVFRNLYRLQPGDEVQVWDQLDREHAYAVSDVLLVPPADTSVMDATPDETLTLITCGGTFDPRTREFSDRLIVRAKPL
jgi:LPXTG-site transpeptidase (sortase) family protein